MSELSAMDVLEALADTYCRAGVHGEELARALESVGWAPEAQVREQVAREISADLVLYAEIEALAAGRNHSTAADKIQDAVVAHIVLGGAR